MSNDLQPLDETQAKLKVGDLTIKAGNLANRIIDTESWYEARELRRDAKLLDKHADKWFDELKKPMNAALKAVRDKEKEVREPLADIMGLLDRPILAYEEEEERQRDKLIRDLTDKARANAQATRDATVADLEKAGNQQAADELKASPLFVPPITLPAINKAYLEGESRTEGWGVDEDSIDIDQLAAAVVAGQLPSSVLLPSIPILNNMAKALKQSGTIPGCKIIKKRGIKQL